MDGGEVIEYESETHVIQCNIGLRTLESSTNQGIKCTWNGAAINSYSQIENSWKFKWDELKNEGFSGLTGYINVQNCSYPMQPPARFKVNITEANDTVEKIISNYDNYSIPVYAFEYHLTPYYGTIEEIPYETQFERSDQTDAILVVEGKKMHVNKGLLCLHSEFFRALFSSNFKEGQMDEIPIQDVTFEDIGMLLSMIIPFNSYPNDQNCEELLELADRFMMPSVIHQVEYHLLNLSEIYNGRLLMIADKFNMPKLLEKSLREISTKEEIKEIYQSPGYKEMSDETKLELFDRMVLLD